MLCINRSHSFSVFILCVLIEGCGGTTNFVEYASRMHDSEPKNAGDDATSKSPNVPSADAAPETEACQLASKPLPPPSAKIDLKELYHWTPNGSNPVNINVMVTPVVGNLIGSKPSIVFVAFGSSYASGGNVVAIDAATGKHQWESPLLASTLRAAAIGDLDGDGKNEVIIKGNDNYVYALNGSDGSVKWKSDNIPGNTPIGGASIADVDGDGSVEIAYGNKIYNGKDGTTKLSINGDILPAVLKDRGRTLIAGSGIMDPKSGATLCSFAVPIYNPAYAVMRENETFSTILGSVYPPKGSDGTLPNSMIYAYRSSDCSLIFKTTLPTTGGGPINIGDFDGDGELEFGTAGQSKYIAFETDGSIKWTVTSSDYSSSATGSTSFDLNGDGKTEVLYADEHTFYIFDGATGGIIYQTENSSGTLTENPVVADINGDGHAKIIIAANKYAWGNQSGVRVLSAPDNDWVGTRPVWNQHSYNVFNVSDSGSVTKDSSDENWHKAVTKPYLLGFRNNIAIPLKGKVQFDGSCK